MAQAIGIPIKEENTVFPTTKIIFLGLELDSAEMEIRLPDDKLLKLMKNLTYYTGTLIFDRVTQFCMCCCEARDSVP
jgi:hypothetical protein